MYLYSALYCFIAALSSTASHVLLAANIEDFRTIAKQFVPDSMADEIFKMVKEAVGRDSSKKVNKYPEFRDIEPDPDVPPKAHDTEVTVRSEHRQKTVSESKSTKRTTSRYELSLDDIVEKVKKRLEAELAMMAATADSKKTTQESYEKRKVPIIKQIKPQSSILEDGQPSRYINPPVRYVKQTRDDMEKITQEHTGRGRYSQHQTTDKPVELEPEHAPKPESHKVSTNPHHVNNKENNDREIHRFKRVTSSSLSAKNLPLNESYENYATPKKDEDYIKQDKDVTIHETIKINNYYTKIEPVDQTNKRILNIFSDEYESTTKVEDYVNYEDETINYNKKKKNVKNGVGNKFNKNNNKSIKQRFKNKVLEILPFKVPDNNEQEIQPYREEDEKNVQEKAYIIENEQPVTKKHEEKSIFYNEHSIRQYAPDHEKHDKRNRYNINKKHEQVTVIPKKDKLSKPNNLVEPYFDESKPDEDRLPENSEPVDNAPVNMSDKMVVFK